MKLACQCNCSHLEWIIPSSSTNWLHVLPAQLCSRACWLSKAHKPAVAAAEAHRWASCVQHTVQSFYDKYAVVFGCIVSIIMCGFTAAVKDRCYPNQYTMLRTLLAALQYPHVGDPLPETWQQYRALFDWIACHKVVVLVVVANARCGRGHMVPTISQIQQTSEQARAAMTGASDQDAWEGALTQVCCSLYCIWHHLNTTEGC